MKRVLLISNQPLDGTGGRAAKFRARTELLPEHGWEVVFCHAPSGIGSFPHNVYRAWKLARREDVDVIQSICSPPDHPLIGLVTSLLTGLPWLLMVRDPLVTNPAVEKGSASWYARRILEAVYVRFADRVTWMDGIQMREDYFVETYPNLPESKWVQLPYIGYVEETYRSAELAEIEGFTITYAGSFYEGWIEPYNFLAGLGEFFDVNPGADVTAQFYGDWEEDYQKAAEEACLEGQIETHGFIPHEDLVPILKGSDVVLYIGGTDSSNKLSVPSKIWDYIGSRTPILAVVDTSFTVATLLKETGLGVVAHPNDPAEIAEKIEDLYEDRFEYAPDSSVFERFTRDRHVAALADTLDKLLAIREN